MGELNTDRAVCGSGKEIQHVARIESDREGRLALEIWVIRKVLRLGD